jgi:hypothetical protein
MPSRFWTGVCLFHEFIWMRKVAMPNPNTKREADAARFEFSDLGATGRTRLKQVSRYLLRRD